MQFVLELRGEVRRHWGAARNSFLAIGRALVAAEARLSKFEYERLRAGMDRLFPFGDAVASQLRKVARAVDESRIPESDCPGSYATAYQIAVLKPNELELAIARGLVRPSVTRKEIISFRNEIRRTRHARTGIRQRQIGTAYVPRNRRCSPSWRKYVGASKKSTRPSSGNRRDTGVSAAP